VCIPAILATVVLRVRLETKLKGLGTGEATVLCKLLAMGRRRLNAVSITVDVGFMAVVEASVTFLGTN